MCNMHSRSCTGNKDKYYVKVCVCDEAGIKTIADNKVEPEIKKSL